MPRINIETLRTTTLGYGAGSENPCLMQAISLITGEGRTDKPSCVHPILRSIGISLNDEPHSFVWNDLDVEQANARRNKLKAFIPRLIGTWDAEDRRNPPAYDAIRLRAIDVGVREWAPMRLGLQADFFTPAVSDLLRAQPTVTNQNRRKIADLLGAWARRYSYSVETQRHAEVLLILCSALTADRDPSIFIDEMPYERRLEIFEELIQLGEQRLDGLNADACVIAAAAPEAVLMEV